MIHIFGGGTVSHVRPHLALAAPAYGGVARFLGSVFPLLGETPTIHLTKMAASGQSDLETNADIGRRIDELVANPATKMIVMTAALCDFDGAVVVDPVAVSEPWTPSSGYSTESGKDQPRLKSNHDYTLTLTPAEKIIGRIRKTRKDIFLVGFKTTAGATSKDQFEAGLTLLKKSSCNLVFANDVHTRRNMVITPEQARYHETEKRTEALFGLVQMALSRSKLTFTRSTVVSGDPVPWSSEEVPPALRTVVDHCIAQGAYKPFLGSTVGHFAAKLGDEEFLTSRRKTNFNDMSNVGMVRVKALGDNEVIAYGSRPSVGGQSQRIVFAEHPDTDCIVHMHCPLKIGSQVPVRSQRELECGSHECGSNTSQGLQRFDVGGGQQVYAVMLDKHGPNIVFDRQVEPAKVIKFIEENFDLSRATSE